MNIPLQDPFRQYVLLRAEVDSSIHQTLQSGRYLMGNMTLQFEKTFAAYCGVMYAIAVSNGTDALELALVAAGAKGRDVVTVANAGGYTTTACRVIGARPVYVDIEPESLLISLPAALSAVTHETAAIVVTHLYGRMVDIRGLRAALNRLGREDITIIEDCAQAHGAELDGQRAGSIGDIATFSFYPTKNLGALGDAGALACKDERLKERLVKLRQYGWQERYNSQVSFGRNSRMDELQAAILIAKLPHLDSWNERRRTIVSRYKSAAPESCSAWFADDLSFVAHLAVTRHPERDRVKQILHEAGIATDIHYPILDCDQQSQIGLPMVVHNLVETRRAVEEIITLPCFPELTDVEIAHVCDGLSRIG